MPTWSVSRWGDPGPATGSEGATGRRALRAARVRLRDGGTGPAQIRWRKAPESVRSGPPVGPGPSVSVPGPLPSIDGKGRAGTERGSPVRGG